MAKKTKKNLPRLDHQNALSGCILDRDLARRDAKQLGLHKGDLPNSIKEVIGTLTQAGFEAYIVGGGVRDSLLRLKPKDFDAVTNATPSQIKEVFGKRCRIIGRRFQLCHVYSGRDMIEVATFRAPPKDSLHTTQEGMLMRDNVWGDIFQDVVRRDFSINALYYQPLDDVVYDFCGGLADIENRVIRLLGDSQKRVEEDPVRLLRALRFKAKLQFNFDKALESQFNPQNWALLGQVSPHRLYDETQKMFTGGYLIPLLPLLFDYGAFSQLLFYPPNMITPLVDQVTINTDKRISSGKSINPAFFYAAILWENYLYLLAKSKKNTPFAEAQLQAAHRVMDRQRQLTAMPKFAEQFIKDIWLMQPRLAEPRKKNLLKLFESPRFRAGFDFLMLREQVEAKNKALASQHGQAITLDTDSTNGMGHWWAWFQTLNAKQQQQAIDEFDLAAVRLRFANIVTEDTVSLGYQTLEHGIDITADAPKTRQQKRAPSSQAAADLSIKAPRAALFFGDAPEKIHKPTEQQQLEKAQLQQLSLASHDSHSRKPAQPAKSLIAQANTHSVTTPEPPTLSEIAEKKPARSRKRHSQGNPSATTGSTAHLHLAAAVPAQRRRRTPSATLSILEQRMAATKENTDHLDNDQAHTRRVNVVAATNDLPTQPKRAPRPRKPVAKTPDANTLSELTTAPVAKTAAAKTAKPTQPAAAKPPKTAPKTAAKTVTKTAPKAAPSASAIIDPILADTVLGDTVLATTKPPAKRSRKRPTPVPSKASTEPSTEPSIDVNKQPSTQLSPDEANK